jgi:hypothetical protein
MTELNAPHAGTSVPGITQSRPGYAPTLADAIGGCPMCGAAGSSAPEAYDHLMDGPGFLERLGIDMKLPVTWQEGAAVGGVVLCIAAAIYLSRPKRKRKVSRT